MRKIICTVFCICSLCICSLSTTVNAEEITPWTILQKAVRGEYDPQYDINKDGRINSMDALLLLRRPKNKNKIECKYDELNRLIQYKCNYGSVEYKYDSCGNRTEIKSIPK